jgi:hypothetical protein
LGSIALVEYSFGARPFNARLPLITNALSCIVTRSLLDQIWRCQ